ncbi:AMP-binding protein [Candidatus Sumerlaeota bacterium]|nr:AMP-binding protein [Candidatus Sumerlaeota bacterium]
MTEKRADFSNIHLAVRTLADVVDAFEGLGAREAFVVMEKAGSTVWSYGQIGEPCLALARGLVRSGFQPGDRAAIFASNRPEYSIAALAAIRAGGVAVPIDAQMGESALRHVLRDCEPRFVFATRHDGRRIEALGPDALGVARIVLLDAEEEDKRSWKRLLEDEKTTLPDPAPSDPAALFYTSGTTGRPKGVPLTHANLAFQIRTVVEAGLVRDDDRILMPLPMHHVYPFVVATLAPLAIGLPIVLPYSRTGPQILRAVAEGGVTLLVGVPRLYGALWGGIRSRALSRGRVAALAFRSSLALSAWARNRFGLRLGRTLFHPLHRRFGPSLRILASGGSALDPALARNLQALGWEIAIGYGLTETSPLLTLSVPPHGQVDTAGRPVPGIELRVDSGEVIARGPNVFSGYRNLPDETREVLSSDGWFRTGDLGFFDSEGFLHLTGRASTLIVTEGGENVQPEDVEAAHESSAAIREIGVFERGGRIVALIVPDLTEIQDLGLEVEEAVRRAVADCSKRIPSYQRLADHAITREQLPRTRLGKIRRHLLADLFDKAKAAENGLASRETGPMSPEEMSDDVRLLLENPVAQTVWDWLAERYGDCRLTPETSPQMDLGVDSLEWLAITMEIRERAGVELSEEAIGRIDTIRDLLEAAVERSEADETPSAADPLEHPEMAMSDRQKKWLRPLNRLQVVLASVLYGIVWLLVKAMFRLRVRGRENLPVAGPYVLAPNHTSYLDPFVLAAALGFRRLRGTYWGAWIGAAFANPFNRWVCRLAQAVPVDADHAVVSSLALGAAVLKRRKNLIWYPEGQRSTRGNLEPFKPGIGILLGRFGTPVVPVHIRGAHRAMPVGRAFPRPRRIEVAFGEPVDAATLREEGQGAKVQDRIVDALRKRVARLGSSSAPPSA